MNNTSVRGLLCGLVVCAGAPVALGQIEVVYANALHAPGHIKTLVPGDPAGMGLTFKNFQRPMRAADGLGWLATPSVNGPSTTQDQVVLVGSGAAASTAVFENFTTDDVGTFIVLGTSVMPRGDGHGGWISVVNGGERIVTGGLTGTPTVVARGNQSPAAPAGITFAATPFGSASMTQAGPAFMASLLASPDGAVEVGIIGDHVVVGCAVTVPTGQAGGTSYAMSDIDANSFWTDATGTRWLAKGKIDNPNTGADGVLVVTGQVVLQEGSPVPGTGGTANVTTLTDAIMEGSGDWCARGSASDGRGWAVVNGALAARVGDPVVPGSSDVYTSLLDVRVNGRGDYVVVGRTNAEADRSDVIVVNGRFIVARESDAVDLDGDGHPEADLFLNIQDNKMMFSDDGYLYFGSRLKASPFGSADANGASTNASLLRVAACPADIGRTGGLAGADAALDNNDFVVFIGFFFNADRRADRGVTGGLPGSDGVFDNNDFIAYIDQFFTGCDA